MHGTQRVAALVLLWGLVALCCAAFTRHGLRHLLPLQDRFEVKRSLDQPPALISEPVASGMHVGPAAVPARTDVTVLVTGLEAGQRLRLVSNAHGTVVSERTAPWSSSSLSWTLRLEPGVYGIVAATNAGFVETGLRITAAPRAVLPEGSSASAGELVRLRPVNFPRSLLGATATFAGLVEHPPGDGMSSEQGAATTFRVREVPGCSPFTAEAGRVVLLESCHRPGHYLSYGRGKKDPPARLAIPPVDFTTSCQSRVAWWLVRPSLTGEAATVSLATTEHSHGETNRYARHAFTRLRTSADAAPVGSSTHRVFAADATWRVETAPGQSCDSTQRSDAKLAALRRPTHRVALTVRVAASGLGLSRGPLGPAVPMHFDLFGHAVPATVANFVGLCTGAHGSSKTGTRLHYRGTELHRVVPGFIAQGGDVQFGRGARGESIWGGAFNDESFALAHDRAGVISMANAGPNTNRAQFFVTFAPQPHLDSTHVAFGRLLAGDEAGAAQLRAVEAEGDAASGKPAHRIVIEDCVAHDLAVPGLVLAPPADAPLELA